MSVTQKDIAREVGVSQAIVSDVLHDRPRGRVSPETRARILEAAERLGYQPNAAAQALRSRQSHQIVYVTLQAEVDQFDALGEQVIGGLARGLAENGYRLLLQVARTPEEMEQQLAGTIAAGACDGCVVRTFAEKPSSWDHLKRLERPVVVIGQCPDPELTSVAHDAPATVQAAVTHLRSRGHRRLGLLTVSSQGDYYRQIRTTWEALGPKLLEDWDRWTAPGIDRREVAELVETWLAEPDGPTAILCFNERATVGATEAVRRRGLTISDGFDLLVVGNVHSFWLYEPGTWVFPTDLRAIGRRAADELLHLLHGHPSPGPIRILPKLAQL